MLSQRPGDQASKRAVANHTSQAIDFTDIELAELAHFFDILRKCVAKLLARGYEFDGQYLISNKPENIGTY